MLASALAGIIAVGVRQVARMRFKELVTSAYSLVLLVLAPLHKDLIEFHFRTLMLPFSSQTFTETLGKLYT